MKDIEALFVESVIAGKSMTEAFSHAFSEAIKEYKEAEKAKQEKEAKTVKSTDTPEVKHLRERVMVLTNQNRDLLHERADLLKENAELKERLRVDDRVKEYALSVVKTCLGKNEVAGAKIRETPEQDAPKTQETPDTEEKTPVRGVLRVKVTRKER